MQRDHRLHTQHEFDVVVDGKVRIPQRVKAQMKEHVDDAPMRPVGKLGKDDMNIATPSRKRHAAARDSPGGNGYGGSISFRLPSRGRQRTHGDA
eukprot:jgi/Tetstr1/434205/TSEL_023316.t1